MLTLIFFLDIAGAAVSFISTIFFIRASIWAWPVGLIATLFNMTLYGMKGIYADMSLEMFYFLSMFYGWYEWKRGGKQHRPLGITHITFQMSCLLIIVGLIAAGFLVWILKVGAHSQVPYFDALTTVVSLIAQFLMCRKIIESWILWFIVDAVYVMLYTYKGIFVHSVVWAIYIGMAALGYLSWKRKMTHG